MRRSRAKRFNDDLQIVGQMAEELPTAVNVNEEAVSITFDDGSVLVVHAGGAPLTSSVLDEESLSRVGPTGRH